MNDIDILFRNIFYRVENLNIKILYVVKYPVDNNYLNANQWEEMLKNLQRLRSFHSIFWIERQWFFKHQLHTSEFGSWAEFFHKTYLGVRRKSQLLALYNFSMIRIF